MLVVQTEVFLKFIKTNSNFNHMGIDISKFAIKNARKKKLNAKNINIKNFYKKNKKKKYDIISFWDVIEHVDSLDENFFYARRLLNKNGYIFLVTDIFDSLIGFLGLIIYKFSFGIIKYPVYKFYIKQNSVYFYKKVLFKKINSHKLKVINSFPIDHPIDRINLNFLEKFIVRILLFYW